MKYTLGQQEFEFNTKLRVTMKIKEEFKKTYSEVAENLEKYDANELARLLYCGIDQSVISKQDFTNHILDNLGLAEVYDAVTWFMQQIQYPGLTEDEIEKKLMEKKKKYQKYQD